jgi:hypothetical protein
MLLIRSSLKLLSSLDQCYQIHLNRSGNRQVPNRRTLLSHKILHLPLLGLVQRLISPCISHLRKHNTLPLLDNSIHIQLLRHPPPSHRFKIPIGLQVPTNLNTLHPKTKNTLVQRKRNHSAKRSTNVIGILSPPNKFLIIAAHAISAESTKLPPLDR